MVRHPEEGSDPNASTTGGWRSSVNLAQGQCRKEIIDA